MNARGGIVEPDSGAVSNGQACAVDRSRLPRVPIGRNIARKSRKPGNVGSGRLIMVFRSRQWIAGFVVVIGLAAATPAVAQKRGGILQMLDFASPASMSMIERRRADDASRPVLLYSRFANCKQPRLKDLVIMTNSRFNGWRMEDVWLDR
jgi:hypothetical protein